MEQLTAEQTAEILGITPARIRQLAQAGRIPGTKIAYTWFFSKEEIERISRIPRPRGRPAKK